jgi:Cu2+-exporting ATPase
MGHLSPLAAAILMPLSSVVTLSLVALTFGRAEKKALQARPLEYSVSQALPAAG